METTRIGFGRRLGAYVLDMVFIIGLGYILANLSGDWLENFVDFSKFNEQQLSALEASDTMWLWSVLIPVSTAIMGFIYSLMEGFLGYTIGKLILGIQIGNQDATKANTSKLMARFALKNIGNIFALIGMATLISTVGVIGQVLGIVVVIGCFFVLGEKKLAFHDMIAKTAVYYKTDLSIAEAA